MNFMRRGAEGNWRMNYNLVFIPNFSMVQRMRAICGTRSRFGSMKIASKSFATEDGCCFEGPPCEAPLRSGLPHKVPYVKKMPPVKVFRILSKHSSLW